MKNIFITIIKNSITGFFLGIMVLISCTTKEEGKNPVQTANVTSENVVVLTADQIKTADIQLGKIENKKLSTQIKINGVLDVPPQNLVTIAAPMGGFVKHTELLQGMKVKKGDAIAQMEHVDYIQLQQDYLDSKNQLEFLDLEYQRQQELAKENVSAIKTLQQAKSNYFSMKAKTEGLRAKLQLININPLEVENGNIKNSITITTPISGYVTQVNVNKGSFVNSADVMFKIVDTEHLHAEAQVFEKDVMKLKVGQEVSINLTNETKPRLASVYLIGKEISAERTVRVHCHLNKEDAQLIPGMYFSGYIEVGDKTAMAVPENAIAGFEGKNYLFIATGNNTYKAVEIQIGIAHEGYTEVILPPGFDSSQAIVIQGAYSLLSKLKNAEEE